MRSTKQNSARWLRMGFALAIVAGCLTPRVAGAQETSAAAGRRRVLVYPVSAQADVPKRVVGQLNELLQKLGAGEAGLEWITVPQLAKVVKKPRPMLAADSCKAEVACWAGLGAAGAAQEVLFGRVGLVEGKLTVALIVVDVATSSLARRVVLNTAREQLASDLLGSRDELLALAPSAPAMTIDPTDAKQADEGGIVLEPLAKQPSVGARPVDAAIPPAAPVPAIAPEPEPARALQPAPVEATATATAAPGVRSRLWFGVGLAGVGVGGALLGVGGYFASSASSAYDDGKGAASQVDAAEARSLGDARTERANAFLFAGTAALTAGAAALLYDWLAGGE